MKVDHLWLVWLVWIRVGETFFRLIFGLHGFPGGEIGFSVDQTKNQTFASEFVACLFLCDLFIIIKVFD